MKVFVLDLIPVFWKVQRGNWFFKSVGMTRIVVSDGDDIPGTLAETETKKAHPNLDEHGAVARQNASWWQSRRVRFGLIFCYFFIKKNINYMTIILEIMIQELVVR